VRRTTLLLGSLALLAGCGTHAAVRTTAPSMGSGAPDATTLVPWQPLPPTRPTIPFRLTPPSPDPVRAEHARRCRGADLQLHWRGAGAAAGTMIENVVLDLAAGHPPCAVSGRPGLVARTVEGATLPGSLRMWTVRSRAPVLLTPRQHALVQLTWPSACYDLHGGGSSFTLGYAGAGWTSPVRHLSDVCHFEPDRRLRSIGVSRFVPLHLRPAHRSTSYDGVHVRGPHRLVARPDQPIDFVVTLVARRDVVLDPCPDYRLGASPGPGKRYALNCAAVPWRDALGRPYLPARRPVRFAMHLGATDGTVQKFWWGIVAPGSPPYLGGIVTIR
jgi:hypothetical protein